MEIEPATIALAVGCSHRALQIAIQENYKCFSLFQVKSDLMRCFLCGVCLPKTPFQYDNYQFCSIQCLQNHRNLRPLHKTA